MDGIEAAAIIHERMDVPVVFLTSYSDDATLERAKGAAPAGYLIKPFTDRAVRTVIEVALHRHALESERAAREQGLAALGTMAAVMAHEINNPLTYVTANGAFVADVLSKMLAEMVQVGGPRPGGAEVSRWGLQIGEAVAALADSLDGAERIRSIVRTVGRSGRTEGGRATPVRLARVIDQAAKIVSSQFPPSMQLVRDFRPSRSVLANEVELTQVLTNLLVNAAHALVAADAQAPRITVSAYTDELGRSVAEVGDNGCGIPESIRGRIFDPFFTTKRVGAGTGLGLYLSRSVVAKLGGTLTVSCESSRGTVFRIALPALPETLESAVTPPS